MTDKIVCPMAVDYQVFDLLAKDSFLPPAGIDACPINRVYDPNRADDASKINIFGDKDMSRHCPNSDDVMEIYSYLLQNKPKQAASGAKRDLSDDVRPEYAEDGDHCGGNSQGSIPGAGQVSPGNSRQSARENMIAEAVIAAKAIGNMSAAGARSAEALTKSKTPWERQLANLMSAAAMRAIERKRSYRRIGRRTNASTPEYAIKPGRIRNPKPGILVVGDSSGSISQDVLNVFASECERILSTGKVGYIRLIYCDTVVDDQGQTFRPRDKVTLTPKHSGGTDFEPVWHWQRKHAPDVAAIVYLSDLLGSFGDSKTWPNIPLIWGATTHYDPPVGKAVRIKRG
jgi:hypothetical protein